MQPSQEVDFVIEKGEKFALLTIYRASMDIRENIEIENNFWILQNTPINIIGHWKDWLGTFQTEEIEKADLIIIAKSKSNNLEMLNVENRELWDKVSFYYQLMTLIGIVNSDAGNIVTGSFVGEFPEIREHGEPTKYFRSDGYKLFVKNDFLKINKIYKRLSELYKNKNFARFKRGLQAFFKGMAEEELGNRIHQVVRSIEAIVYPPIGKTREIFSSRCSLLVPGEEINRSEFEEIYDLRSCIEHLHEIENYEKFTPEIKSFTSAEQKKYFFKRFKQAEEFSRLLYMKIILSDYFLPFFETNEKIGQLWETLQSGSKSLLEES